MKSKFRLFFPCYFSFFVNGAMVLLVGAILPYIIEEAGINYSVAVGFLSAFAIVNLIASFVNPPMASKIGRKATIIIFSALIPVMLFVITLLPPVPVIYAAFVLVGIGRGSVSIINNAVVNDNSNGKPTALNLLHMTFAAGAFLAPFITSLYIGNGFGWRAPAYTIIAGSALSVILYVWMEIDYNWPVESKKGKNDTYKIKIVVPAGSTEEIVYQEDFVYSDEEISPIGNKITIYSGDGLGDTEVVLKPISVKEENAYEPTYLTQGMPVEMDVEKGAWFKVGINMQNNTDTDKIVYVEIEGVEVRIE